MEARLVPYAPAAAMPATRALVLAPHPDDEVFGCGGAIALHVRDGVPVRVIIASDGAAGGETQAREAESCAAAALLGYPQPEFWRLPDRGIEYGERLIERIMEAARADGADLLYAPSVHEMHPDHRALAMAAVEAARRLGLRLAMYEVGVPLRPNLLLDITPVLENKRAAMRCFASQLARQRYDEHIDALNRYRSYTLPPEVAAAEAYRLYDGAALEAAGTLEVFESEYSTQARLGLPMDGARDLPLVSVIVRSVDRPVLAQALDSIALQTYGNIEVVVVAANGPDHRELPERCGRFPLRLVGREHAHGRSAAANCGLDHAQGKYICFLDDDDAFDADHLAHLVDLLRRESGDVIMHAGVRGMVRGERRITHLFDTPCEGTARLLAGNVLPIHAPLFPRRLVDAQTRFDESLDVYEDWDFWLQLSRKARFLYSGRITATYFAGGSSGVSHAASSAEAQARGAYALYAKWLARISAEELRAIGLLCIGFQAQWSAAERAKDDLAAQRDSANAAHAASAAECDALRAANASLTAERDALMKARDALSAERDALVSGCEALAAERDGLVAERDMLMNLRDKLAADRTALAAKATSLSDERDVLNAQREALTAQLAAMHASTSWRMTEPMRWIGRLLKGA